MNKKIYLSLVSIILLVIGVLLITIRLNFNGATIEGALILFWKDIRGSTWEEIQEDNIKYFVYSNNLNSEMATITSVASNKYYNITKSDLIKSIHQYGVDLNCSLAFKSFYCGYLIHWKNFEKIEDQKILEALLSFKKMDENNSFPNYLLARYYQKLGDEIEAKSYLDLAISLPNFNRYEKEMQLMTIQFLSQFSDNELFTKQLVLSIIWRPEVLSHISTEDFKNKIIKEVKGDFINTISSLPNTMVDNSISQKEINEILDLEIKIFKNCKGRKNFLKYINNCLQGGQYKALIKINDEYKKTGKYP